MEFNLEDLLGEKLMKRGRETYIDEFLAFREFAAVYYGSASLEFTSTLKKFYSAMNANEIKFEVLWITTETSKEAYDETLATISWYYFKWNDPRVPKIKDFLNLNASPQLIVLDRNFDIVSESGANDVIFNGELARNIWIS